VKVLSILLVYIDKMVKGVFEMDKEKVNRIDLDWMKGG
jgi:hypothetical protein